MEKEQIKNEFVNLTPHGVNFVIGNEMVSIPSSGSVRVGSSIQTIGNIQGIPVTKMELTKISDEDISKIKEAISEGKIVIVSRIAGEQLKKQLPEAIDKIAIVSETVRDNSGRIIGAKSISLIKDI